MIWLDLDVVGESPGPKSQPGLRRKATLSHGELQALIQGTMLGRGAQVKSDENGIEATVPSPCDWVAVHATGRSDPMGNLKKVFRLANSKSDAIDCCQKNYTLIFNETIRQRKTRVRGNDPYSQCTTLAVFSAKPLVPDMVPDKRRIHYAGHSTGDVVGWLELLPVQDFWEAARPWSC